MSAATLTRTCCVCGGELCGRQKSVCSHTCRVAKSRGQLRGALREPKSCEGCGTEFKPKRSDARYCDTCRQRRPWRREPSPPAQLDGAKVWAWIEARGLAGSLNGSRRTLERRQHDGEPIDFYWFDETVLSLLRDEETLLGAFTGGPTLEDELAELWAA